MSIKSSYNFRCRDRSKIFEGGYDELEKKLAQYNEECGYNGGSDHYSTSSEIDTEELDSTDYDDGDDLSATSEDSEKQKLPESVTSEDENSLSEKSELDEFEPSFNPTLFTVDQLDDKLESLHNALEVIQNNIKKIERNLLDRN